MKAGVVVHGGAGVWSQDRVPGAVEGCRKAAGAGAERLEDGAVEAVMAAVKVLESDPQFNAGLGSSLTRDGTVELDAALMTGDMRFGAVGSCPPVESAIELARMVLELNEHSFLVGAGALNFAEEHGIEVLPPEALITQERIEQLEKVSREYEAGTHVFGSGTVGAVAVDDQGVLAAGTSTGGIVYKRSGRVGDTPLVGAGTYADSDLGAAASATGHGEAILRVLLCREAVGRVKGQGVEGAVTSAIEVMEKRSQGKGGLILIDSDGSHFAGKNTAHMPWAYAGSRGEEQGS
ncbi:MAG TPA: isoaspartyl peptidase/L-asparaginase [Actinomycetota bacterium]|nr:isoaspartyl peptidase/L-asparaginase [Actinomycetota bacterium]